MRNVLYLIHRKTHCTPLEQERYRQRMLNLERTRLWAQHLMETGVFTLYKPAGGWSAPTTPVLKGQRNLEKEQFDLLNRTSEDERDEKKEKKLRRKE